MSVEQEIEYRPEGEFPQEVEIKVSEPLDLLPTPPVSAQG